MEARFLIPAVLLGLATNLDNLFLAVTIGLEGVGIPLGQNLLLALPSVAATAVCCAGAAELARFGRLPSVLGGLLLLLLGAFSAISPSEEPQRAPRRLGPGRALTVGAALALNCLPAAFGAGLAGIPALPAAVCVGALSVAAMAVGSRLGLRTARRVSSRRLGVAAGLLMVLLGIWELIF